MPLFGRKGGAAKGPTTLPVTPFGGVPEAIRLDQALAARDWDTAEKLLTEDPGLDSVLPGVLINAARLEEWLPDVMRARPTDLWPQTAYGLRAIGWAWDARSAARAQYVSRDQFEVFFERLRIAEDSLQGVVRRDPDNVAAWYGLIVTARGLQMGKDEARRRFDEVIRRRPGHLGAHTQMLQQLCRKWSGSHEEMHGFARAAILGAPPGSPLGMLAAIAHIEHWLDLDAPADTQYMQSEGVRLDLRTALARTLAHPNYQPARTWISGHSEFACALMLAGEYLLAAEQFRILGDHVTESPWEYLRGDPGEAFCLMRQLAFEKAARWR